MTDAELIAALAEALQALVNTQAGPPVIMNRGEWSEAMCRAQDVLRIVTNRNVTCEVRLRKSIEEWERRIARLPNQDQTPIPKPWEIPDHQNAS